MGQDNQKQAYEPKNKKRKRKKGQQNLQHWQKISIYLLIFDLITVNLSYFFGLFLRYDFKYSSIPRALLHAWGKFAPFYSLICILVFFAFRLYQSMWRFASYNELWRIFLANIVTFLVQLVGIHFFADAMPYGYYLVGATMQFLLVAAPRFAYRFILLLRASRRDREGADDEARVMLIGAGVAGRTILRETISSDKIHERVVCIIDDNPNKWNRYIDGVPIVGGRDDILLNVKKYQVDRIYLAIPSASDANKRDILNICRETDCELKVLPGVYQLVSGQISYQEMREVTMDDLLGRDPIRPDLSEVFQFVNGNVILITGGGGTIGSELARQVARHQPKKLILLDIYENNLYQLQLELREQYPELDLLALIGSVRDSRRMYQIFDQYHPQVVYHAAAHKHVPLMESVPCETIKNNVLGTYKTAYAAMMHGCQHFVLISTDKAVNPTNIMGASKRLCEMVVQSFDAKIKEGKASEIPALFTHLRDEETLENDPVDRKMVEDAEKMDWSSIRTQFVAVRFGNVLGSSGSVIPIFKRQIAEGGPVTVTHPDIIRYFMTIPEAVSLVLSAGTYAKGGEIFVLDMGEPVKIDDMARNLIKLSGYRPDIDIPIVYTGLRPGEKLYEEPLMDNKQLKRTKNNLIFVEDPQPFDADRFIRQLDQLSVLAYSNKEDIREDVIAMVPTYHPAKN